VTKAMHLQKTDIFMVLIDEGLISLRPGGVRLVDEAIDAKKYCYQTNIHRDWDPSICNDPCHETLGQYMTRYLHRRIGRMSRKMWSSEGRMEKIFNSVDDGMMASAILEVSGGIESPDLLLIAVEGIGRSTRVSTASHKVTSPEKKIKYSHQSSHPFYPAKNPTPLIHLRHWHMRWSYEQMPI